MALNLFNKVIDNDMNFLMEHKGKNILINEIESIGIVSNKTNYPNVNILTKDTIRLGDIVQYEGKSYIACESVDKKFEKYIKATLKECNYKVNIAIVKDNKQVVNKYNIFVENRVFYDTIDKAPIPFSYDQRGLIITADDFTNQLKKQDRIIMYGKVWEVMGVDDTVESILDILVKEVSSNEHDNLEKGIPNYWKYNLRYTSITTKNTLPLKVDEGQTVKLDVETNPIGGVVEYLSSDATVATIELDGTMTGLKVGKTTIAMKIHDTDISSSIELEVIEVVIIPPTPQPEVKSVKITSTSKTVSTYKTLKLTTETVPSNEKVTFAFEGAKCKCKFINITDNSCEIKTDGDVGLLTIKASMQSDVTVTGSIKIQIKEDW